MNLLSFIGNQFPVSSTAIRCVVGKENNFNNRNVQLAFQSVTDLDDVTNNWPWSLQLVVWRERLGLAIQVKLPLASLGVHLVGVQLI